MMNRIIVLTKLFCQSIFENIFNFKNKKSFSRIELVLSLMISIFFISLPLIISINLKYNTLALSNNQNRLLDMIIISATITDFFLGIITVLSIFFFSKDIEIILSFPVKPGEIIISKLLSCFVYCVGITLFIVPPLVFFGMLEGKGIIYYIIIILTVLIMPIVPMCIVGVFCLVLMRFSNFSKNKDLFKILISIIVFLCAIAMQLIISYSFKNNYGVVGEGIFNNDIMNVIISSRMLVMALQSNNIESFIYVLVSILISIIAIFLFYYVGQKIYFKSVMGSNEVSSNREKLSDDIINKKVNERPIITNFIINDIKMLIRTPTYFIKCILSIMILPIILIIICIQNYLIIGEDLSDFIYSIRDFPINYVILVIGVSIGFFSLSNPTASSSFSREGQEFYNRKYLPIKFKTQVFAKYLTALIINIIQYLFVLILVIFVFKIEIKAVIFGAILGFLFISLNSAIGVVIDMKSPKLIWDNEQRAVKGNINIFNSMLIGMIITVVIILVGIITSPSLIVMIFIQGLILLYGNYVVITTMLNDAEEDLMRVE